MVFVAIGHAATQVFNESLLAQQSQSPPPITTIPQSPSGPPVSQRPQATPAQTPPSELANLEAKVRPSVIWVTTFDSKGNLLRTETGFFISADGRFITTAHATEGGVNAVVKTADGGIYNVTGVLTVSKSADLAVLKAEIKPQKLLRFLDLNKTGELSVGAKVAVVGSALAGSEGTAREATVTGQSSDRLEIAGATAASAVGSPVVNENGDVIGVVTSAGEKTVARPVAALDSVLSRVTADTQARWPQVAQASPTPHATPKPRLLYAPAPSFPPGQSLPGQSGTGRFRLTFDPEGNVRDIRIVSSTGNPYFDQAAIKTLQQWKSAPSQGWQATVPVTFKTR
ncbi:MAG TPA: TonB family protein [Candidatus Udaeobacter sp.]|nr:TonB family protein [Candidatus Udaeobacter sp.]